MRGGEQPEPPARGVRGGERHAAALSAPPRRAQVSECVRGAGAEAKGAAAGRDGVGGRGEPRGEEQGRLPPARPGLFCSRERRRGEGGRGGSGQGPCWRLALSARSVPPGRQVWAKCLAVRRQVLPFERSSAGSPRAAGRPAERR